MNNLQKRLARIPELIERAEAAGDYREAEDLCAEARQIEDLQMGWDVAFNEAFA